MLHVYATCTYTCAHKHTIRTTSAPNMTMYAAYPIIVPAWEIHISPYFLQGGASVIVINGVITPYTWPFKPAPSSRGAVLKP